MKSLFLDLTAIVAVLLVLTGLMLVYNYQWFLGVEEKPFPVVVFSGE